MSWLQSSQDLQDFAHNTSNVGLLKLKRKHLIFDLRHVNKYMTWLHWAKTTAAACFQHVQPKSIHDSLKASDLYPSAADSQFRAGSKTTTFSLAGSGNSCDCDWWRLVGPFGEISRVQHLALTDPRSRKLVAPAIGLMAVFDQKTPRSLALPLKAPTWPEVMNFATMLAKRTSRWLAFIFALILRSWVMGQWDLICAKTSVFYYEWLLKSFHRPWNKPCISRIKPLHGLRTPRSEGSSTQKATVAHRDEICCYKLWVNIECI